MPELLLLLLLLLLKLLLLLPPKLLKLLLLLRAGERGEGQKGRWLYGLGETVVFVVALVVVVEVVVGKAKWEAPGQERPGEPSGEPAGEAEGARSAPWWEEEWEAAAAAAAAAAVTSGKREACGCGERAVSLQGLSMPKGERSSSAVEPASPEGRLRLSVSASSAEALMSIPLPQPLPLPLKSSRQIGAAASHRQPGESAVCIRRTMLQISLGCAKRQQAWLVARRRPFSLMVRTEGRASRAAGGVFSTTFSPGFILPQKRTVDEWATSMLRGGSRGRLASEQRESMASMSMAAGPARRGVEVEVKTTRRTKTTRWQSVKPNDAIRGKGALSAH
eukprot:m.163422 g.163422  ORF g.163422 m.163422 type:complete len:334 (+) comp17110_c11_seq1:3054-4055(+)